MLICSKYRTGRLVCSKGSLEKVMKFAYSGSLMSLIHHWGLWEAKSLSQKGFRKRSVPFMSWTIQKKKFLGYIQKQHIKERDTHTIAAMSRNSWIKPILTFWYQYHYHHGSIFPSYFTLLVLPVSVHIVFYGLPTASGNRSNWRHVKTHVRSLCFGIFGDYFSSQDCGCAILLRMTRDVCKRVGMLKSLNIRRFGQHSNQLRDSYHDS